MTVSQELAAPRIREAPQTKEGFYEARPGDVITRGDLCLIDVREIEADLLGDLGHIHNAYHVPAPTLEKEGLPALPKSTPIVVVCQNGHRSRRCASELAGHHGFLEVYHLVGGMIRWLAEERPVARTRTWRAFPADT